MMAQFQHAVARVAAFLRPLAFALVWATALAGPARAVVEVRVEGRPVSDPVEVYVKVTNGAGTPVSGLDSGDFEIFEDNVGIPLQPGDLTLPPSGGGVQHVSVVFVMDYSGTVQSTALEELEAAVNLFIDNMQVGDAAAIIKFNNSNGPSVEQEFLLIDDGDNDNALKAAVDAPYPGTGTPLLDAVLLGINQFVTPSITLPTGPKAIILVSDGGENQSDATENEVIALANEHSIPVFTIGVGDTTQPGRTDLMQGLGDETGGLYYPPEPGNVEYIAEAYASIAELLSNEYLIQYASAITDCDDHALRVKVVGQASVTVHFTRRACDTEPDAFDFPSQTGVAPNATVTSSTETISGLTDGVPAHISVLQGSYSIGCNGTFTTDPGTISDGESVCVQHQASGNFNTSKTTTLTIGGVAGTFRSTTRQDNGGGGGGGGGGGAAGLLELLFLAGLGLLLAGRRGVA